MIVIQYLLIAHYKIKHVVLSIQLRVMFLPLKLVVVVNHIHEGIL